jgi:hypothetical protein
LLVERNFARSEAKSLLRLIGKNGESEQTILDLISVRPEQEQLLRERLGNAPELLIALRQRVLVEFEFLKLLERKPQSKTRLSARERRIANVIVAGMRRGKTRTEIALHLFPNKLPEAARYQLSKFICKNSAAIEEAMHELKTKRQLQ